MAVLAVEHPDGGGPGVFGDVAAFTRWRPFAGEPPPKREPQAIVLFGGSTDVVDAPALPWLRDELAWLAGQLEAGVPTLGVCLGAQLVAAALGAPVRRCEPPEIGWLPVELTAEAAGDPVGRALPRRFTACQWHSWTHDLPPGATALARSEACLQAYRAGSAYGVQFHPEVDGPTLERWIARHHEDPAAVAQGFDRDAARAQAAERLAAWNALGRDLFAAFLAVTH